MKIISSLIIISLVTYFKASATLTWHLEKIDSAEWDEIQAYTKIVAAMEAGVNRWNNWGAPDRHITAHFNWEVDTVDGKDNNSIRFGPKEEYMTERVVLHEIGHVLGVGMTKFDDLCDKHFPRTTILLKELDGEEAFFSCGGRHFWPYGLNYETEFSNENADRHIQIIKLMIEEGM